MNNFEAAVELALDEWIASLPTEFDLPEPTESYKKGIEKLMDKMRGDRYHRLTRSAARAVLIAAILLAIATITLAATVGREFIVEKFSNFSSYTVVDDSDVEGVEDINIGYIPKGFELVSKEGKKYLQSYVYYNNNKWISIYKSKISDDITFDTEYKNSESLTINGIEGIYFNDKDLNYSGVVWNNGSHIYLITGNITKDQLIKIAESIT